MTSWTPGTSLVVTTVALIVITVVAQLLLNLATPVVNSLLVFLTGK